MKNEAALLDRIQGSEEGFTIFEQILPAFFYLSQLA
jgi:hypothetical protein